MMTDTSGASPGLLHGWNERTAPLSRPIPEIESSGFSVVGPVREDNQDSIHMPDLDPANPDGHGLLFAVADGMGGYAHGAVASRMALDILSGTFVSGNHSTPIRKVLKRGIEKANLDIYQKAHQLGAGRIGTTLTAAYLIGNLLHLAHIGDSRAYLIRDGRATCLSADHTVVGDMVRGRLLTPDKIRSHAQRSILTKAIGIGLFVQPDITRHRLHEGDCLILCSDGVWSVVQDDDFARIASHAGTVKKIGEGLIELALRNNTDDNASVVVVHINRPSHLPEVHRNDEDSHTHWLDRLRKLVP